MKKRTLAEALQGKKKEVTKELPKEEVTLDPTLKKDFTKVALDLGSNYDEIYSMLSDLEHTKHANWYEDFKEEFDAGKLNGNVDLKTFKKKFPNWVNERMK